MSATDSLGPQWKQGKMFHTPTELATEYHPIDTQRFGYKNDEEMWDYKLYEAKKPAGTGDGSGVHDALRAGKIDRPIGTSSPAEPGYYPEYSTDRENLNDGHHRVAVGLEMEREGKEVYLPVLHADYRSKYAKGY